MQDRRHCYAIHARHGTGNGAGPCFIMINKIKKKWYIVFPIFLFMASCLDLTTTLIAKHTTSRFVEANPIMAYLLDNYGDFWTSVTKIIATIVTCWGAWWLLKKNILWITTLITLAGIVIYWTLGIIWISWWIIYFL